MKGFCGRPVSFNAHAKKIPALTMKSILTRNALIESRHTRQMLVSLLLLCLLTLAEGPARAATLRWTGAHATSSDWSRGANWDSGTAPANDDILVFPAGAARLSNNNDLTGLRVATIRFTGAGGGYTISGNAITLTDGINAINTVAGNTVALARITLVNPLSFTVATAGLGLTIDSEVRLNGNNLTGDATGFLILRGVVSGDGDVIKTGAGLLTVSGPVGNTFTGDLLVNAGRLVMQKTAGLAVPNRLVVGDGTGGAGADVAIHLANDQVTNVVVNASGLWDLNGFSNLVKDLVLNNGGDVDTRAAGNLRLNPGANVTVTAAPLIVSQDASIISGNFELLLGNHTFTVAEGPTLGSDPSDLQITAEVSGLLASITKEGSGDLLLSGNNSLGGNVTVNAGEVRLGHSAALGGTVGVTLVNNDAGLQINGGLSIGAEKLILNSTGRSGVTGYPALEGIGTSSWAGDIELQQSARIGVTSGGTLTLSGTLSGTGGVVKENTGTLRLSGNSAPNTYVGTTFVNAGTLELDKGTIGGVVAVPGLLVIGDDAGGEHADVVRNLKDNQVNRVTVNGSGFWDLNGHAEEVSDLVLNQGGDVDSGSSGNLRLGINADVTVTPGTAAGTDISSISGNLELLLGTHRFTVDNGNSGQGDGNLIITAVVSGAGGITKAGRDKMELLAANSFAALVTIDEGQLIVGDPLALGLTIAGTRVNDSGMLSLFGGGTVSGESLTLDSDGLNPPDMPNALVIAGDWEWTGDVTLLRESPMNILSAASLDMSGAISGAGGVMKNGGGTLTLSGNSANTYSGVTTVNEGRLHLNKTGVNVAVPGRLIIGDDVGGANADVVECLSVNEIGESTTVTVNGSGQLILSLESIGALAGSGNVAVSGSLNVGNAGTTTVFHGVISGAGSFNKIGTGTLTFNGDNTYTGGTGIADGTLIVNGQQPASFVLIQPAGTLGGSGRVGNLSSFAGGATVSPGASPGRLSSGNLNFGVGTVFRVELDGPVAGTTHDQLRAFGTVDLNDAVLQATLNFIPTLGQPLVILDNDGSDAVTDRFNGLAEGDTIRLNQIPFVISYEGGDGNDVTLTATNKTISVVSTRIEAGNGNGVIDPNECNHLFVALMNETAAPLGVSRVVLDSATPGVVVTQQESDYANFAALGLRENNPPFQFRTAPDFECGRLVEFLMTVTVSGSGTFTIPFTMPSGSGGTPVRFDNGANLALADNAQTTSILNVSSAAPHVGKVAVSLHITHPSAGDLVLRLRSPSGNTVRLASNLGGTTDNYGTGCGDASRATLDDAASLRIAAGTAPFVGSFTPEEPLATFLGEDPNGDWTLLINDTVAGDTGELRCWSLFISPPECSDGGGQCETCVPNLSGRFNADMPSTTTRLVRDGVPSGCGSAKICPTVTTGARLFYRVHLVTNTGPATCVSVVLNDLCRASNLRLHAAAYLNSYNPADPCANYLGDTGTELTAGSTSFSFAAPENAVIAIVVSSPVTATTCPISYGVQLHGLPCPPPTLHIAKTGNPEEVRLFWSTAYPDYDLQRTPTLNGAAPYPFVNVPFTPFVVNGDYSVTNSTSGADAYYRLRKP